MLRGARTAFATYVVESGNNSHFAPHARAALGVEPLFCGAPRTCKNLENTVFAVFNNPEIEIFEIDGRRLT